MRHVSSVNAITKHRTTVTRPQHPAPLSRTTHQSGNPIDAMDRIRSHVHTPHTESRILRIVFQFSYSILSYVNTREDTDRPEAERRARTGTGRRGHDARVERCERSSQLRAERTECERGAERAARSWRGHSRTHSVSERSLPEPECCRHSINYRGSSAYRTCVFSHDISLSRTHTNGSPEPEPEERIELRNQCCRVHQAHGEHGSRATAHAHTRFLLIVSELMPHRGFKCKRIPGRATAPPGPLHLRTRWRRWEEARRR